MRGQTAIEYLMTYGWAILIILIVAGVLAYYGIFAPAGFLGPTARGFGQLQVLNPWSMDSTGTMTLNIQNQVGGPVNPTNISFQPTGGTVVYCNADPYTANISSGGQAVISCDTAGTYTTGDSYTATVTISYSFGGSSFSTTGTLSGTYS